MIKKFKIEIYILLLSFFINIPSYAHRNTIGDVGVYFTFTNGTVVRENDSLFYDCQISIAATENTTRFGSGMVYVYYNTDAFGENIVASSHIHVKKGTLLSDELIPGSPLYNIVNVVDNTPNCFAVTTDFSFSNNPELGTILPSEPIDYLDLRFSILDQNQAAGLSFRKSLMDGQQYYSDNRTVYCPVVATDEDSTLLPIATPSMPDIPQNICKVYPNPCRITHQPATIAFALAHTSDATVSIYNVKGQCVQKKYIKDIQRGETQHWHWDGNDNKGKPVSAGMYFYKISTDDVEYKQQLLLLR